MVRLRLQRHGAKKRPFYRLVAADKRASRDGRFIELLGTFDPLQEPPLVRLNKARIDYWMGVGAQPSETAAALIKKLEKGEAIDLSAEGQDAAAAKARREQRESERAAARAEAKKASDAAAKQATEEKAAEEKAAEEKAAEENATEQKAADEAAAAPAEEAATEEAAAEEAAPSEEAAPEAAADEAEPPTEE